MIVVFVLTLVLQIVLTPQPPVLIWVVVMIAGKISFSFFHIRVGLVDLGLYCNIL